MALPDGIFAGGGVGGWFGIECPRINLSSLDSAEFQKFQEALSTDKFWPSFLEGCLLCTIRRDLRPGSSFKSKSRTVRNFTPPFCYKRLLNKDLHVHSEFSGESSAEAGFGGLRNAPTGDLSAEREMK
jgi:hypothetical protein